MKGKQQGVTLLEVIVVIGIIAIMLTFAVPNIHSLLRRQQLQTIANEWRASYYFARTLALDEKKEVIFCPSVDGQTCNMSQTASFAQGWIVGIYKKTAGNQYDVVRVDLDVAPISDKVVARNTRPSKKAILFDRKGNLQELGAAGLSIIFYSDPHPEQIKLIISGVGRLRTERTP